MSAHANCTHAKTKSARAACRRDTKNFPGTKLAAPAATLESRLERELAEYDENPGQMPKAAGFKWEPGTNQGRFNEEDEWVTLSGQPVTRENWKTYRDLVLELTITTHGAQGDHFIIGKAVAWGEKFFRYVSQTGASTMVDVERVRHAFVA